MDENLAINTTSFLNNPLISPFNIEMQNLVECIKASKKLHYDNKQKLIRFKEKADRNIVIFKDQVSSNEDFENFKNQMTSKIKEKSQEILPYLKDVEKIDKNAFFNFECEKFACDLEKILDDSKKNKENFFVDLNYFLAAETYGRRISPMLNKKITQEEQIEIIRKTLENFKPLKKTVEKKSENKNDKRRNTYSNNQNKKKLSVLDNSNNNNNKDQEQKNFKGKKHPESFKEKNKNFSNKFERLNSLNLETNKFHRNSFKQSQNLGYTPYYQNPKRNSAISNNPSSISNFINDETSNYFNNSSIISNEAKYFESGFINTESNNNSNASMYNNKHNSFIHNKSNSNIILNISNSTNPNQSMNKFDSISLRKNEEENKNSENNSNNNNESNNSNSKKEHSSKKLDPKNENLFDVKKILGNISTTNSMKRNSININSSSSISHSNSFYKLNPKEVMQVNGNNHRGSFNNLNYIQNFNNNNNINVQNFNNIDNNFSRLSTIKNIPMNNINSTKNSFISNGEIFNVNTPFKDRKSSLNYLDYFKNNNNLSNVRTSILSQQNNNKENKPKGENEYSTSDIISVYFHMNYLKQFKFPEEFDKNFLEGVMRKEVKHSLEKFKEKDVLFRSRAKTQILQITNNLKKRSKIFYFLFKFLISFISFII